jgi:hypothetical protein
MLHVLRSGRVIGLGFEGPPNADKCRYFGSTDGNWAVLQKYPPHT